MKGVFKRIRRNRRTANRPHEADSMVTRTTNRPHDADSMTIRTAASFQEKLPRDLIPLVLDYAEMWTTIAKVAVEKGEQEVITVNQATAGLVVVQCTLPAGMPARTVRRIRFTTTSKDQGWSSYPNDHGTYGNSWTWFEAGIKPKHALEKSQVDTELDRDDGDSLASSSSPADSALKDGYTLPPRSIVTNVHAGREWVTHNVTWDLSSDDEETRVAIRRLKGGDTIELSMFARYPGWVNNLRFASIQVEGVYVRKM